MNNSPTPKIPDTEDAWDIDGQLGHDEEFTIALSDDVSKSVDDALGLQPISIRLQRNLLDNLKALAQLNGLGYQPLIRQVLTRFVDCELKTLLAEKLANERKAAQVALDEAVQVHEQIEQQQKRAA